MCKNLTMFRAFAVFVLILGWSIIPAHAHDCEKHNNTDHKHCSNEDPTPGPATLVLNDGMDYPAGEPLFTVRVGRDSPKKIGFNNTNFNLASPGIIMRFNVDPGSCTAQYGAVDENDKILLGGELNNAEITKGYFEAEVDKKNKTGTVIVQYDAPGPGLVRIILSDQFGLDPPIVEEPSEDVFQFRSEYVIAWHVLGGNNDKIISCKVDPQLDPTLELILNR